MKIQIREDEYYALIMLNQLEDIEERSGRNGPLYYANDDNLTVRRLVYGPFPQSLE